MNGAPQYAFLQYCDIASVCKAIKKMDGEYLGNNRLKVRMIDNLILTNKFNLYAIILYLSHPLQLGFGKSMPTTCVWLDGLASNTTEQFLTRHFCRYGHVVKASLFIFCPYSWPFLTFRHLLSLFSSVSAGCIRQNERNGPYPV